ncbi:MAG: peptidoglycan DD-metalloendopeptidase family protein [Nitriliruptoraceae bacterium]
MSRLRSLAIIVGLAAALQPVTASAVTQDQLRGEIEDAERHIDDLELRLDEATENYESTWARIEETKVELDELSARATRLERDARSAERLLSERARSVFKQGSATAFETLLTSGGPQQAVERAAMISTLQLREGTRLEDAVAARVALDQTLELLADREQRLDELQADLDVQARELSAALSQAEARASSLRTMLERQVRIDRGVQQGIYACIFDNAFRFRDTWGAPRSGGRRHRGTDVFAPYNQPVYAFTSGVVRRTSWSGLGGLGLYLRGDDGNVYYYAHLNSVEQDGQVGTRVGPGQLIARNGSTGNASASAPHVHFEIHPGGGSAINPYQWLAAACFR